MLGNHSDNSHNETTERAHVRRTTMLVLIAALAVVAVLGIVLALTGHKDSSAAPEETAAVSASPEESEPVSEPPAESEEASPEETDVSPAPAEETAGAGAAEAAPLSAETSGAVESVTGVPSDTSGDMLLRYAQKMDGFPMLSWDKSCLKLDSRGRMQYTGSFSTMTGIDVSEHQYDVDWEAVADDGIEFVMIRVGRRGSTEGGLYTDEYFEQNIKGALKAGLRVGVYFYSQAVSEAEAKEEAEYVLDAIRDYDVTFPVVFDWEIVGGEEARTFGVSRRELCDYARVFCDRIAEEGYTPMIYFTRYLGYRKYILRELTDYGFWYAEYEELPSTIFDFTMWQYSESGKVDGIDGEVDLNIYRVE